MRLLPLKTGESLKSFFNSAARHISGEFNRMVEMGRDIWTALREPSAMSAEQRRLDEFKIFAGAATTVFGLAEVTLTGIAITVLGGIEPVWDGLQDLEKAGHEWRTAHPVPPPAAP